MSVEAKLHSTRTHKRWIILVSLWRTLTLGSTSSPLACSGRSLWSPMLSIVPIFIFPAVVFLLVIFVIIIFFFALFPQDKFGG